MYEHVCIWKNERVKRKVSSWVIIFLSTGSWTNLPQIGALSVHFSKYREWASEGTDVLKCVHNFPWSFHLKMFQVSVCNRKEQEMRKQRVILFCPSFRNFWPWLWLKHLPKISQHYFRSVAGGDNRWSTWHHITMILFQVNVVKKQSSHTSKMWGKINFAPSKNKNQKALGLKSQ